MYSILKKGGAGKPMNFTVFICDTEADLAKLPTSQHGGNGKILGDCAKGSIAKVINKGDYVLNSNDQWVKINDDENIRPATRDKIGGVKIGDGINVETDGTISVDSSGSSMPDPSGFENGTALLAINGEWVAQNGYGYKQEVTFDGHHSVDTPSFREYTTYYPKVSDTIFTAEELLGATVTAVRVSTGQEHEVLDQKSLTPTNIRQGLSGGSNGDICVGENMVRVVGTFDGMIDSPTMSCLVSGKKGASFSSFTLPEDGTYFAYTSNSAGYAYVSNLSLLSVPIDEDLLPDNIKIPEHTASDEGKVLKVQDGELAWRTDEALPDATDLENGTALVVVDGEWKQVDGYGHEIKTKGDLLCNFSAAGMTTDSGWGCTGNTPGDFSIDDDKLYILDINGHTDIIKPDSSGTRLISLKYEESLSCMILRDDVSAAAVTVLITGEDTQSIMQDMGVLTDGTLNEIAIYEAADGAVPFDTKYIPTTIATKAYVDAAIGGAINGSY